MAQCQLGAFIPFTRARALAMLSDFTVEAYGGDGLGFGISESLALADALDAFKACVLNGYQTVRLTGGDGDSEFEILKRQTYAGLSATNDDSEPDYAGKVMENGWQFNGDEWNRPAHTDDSDGSFTRVEGGVVYADTAYSAWLYDGLDMPDSESGDS